MDCHWHNVLIKGHDDGITLVESVYWIWGNICRVGCFLELKRILINLLSLTNALNPYR